MDKASSSRPNGKIDSENNESPITFRVFHRRAKRLHSDDSELLSSNQYLSIDCEREDKLIAVPVETSAADEFYAPDEMSFPVPLLPIIRHTNTKWNGRYFVSMGDVVCLPSIDNDHFARIRSIVYRKEEWCVTVNWLDASSSDEDNSKVYDPRILYNEAADPGFYSLRLVDWVYSREHRMEKWIKHAHNKPTVPCVPTGISRRSIAFANKRRCVLDSI